MVMNRQWSMPSPDTFAIPPIAELLSRYLHGCAVIVDPFARDSILATHRNDLNPKTRAQWHLPADGFCATLIEHGVEADAVLFDPPYSPRQISEVYAKVGITATTTDTQNAALYKRVRDGLDAVLKPNGIAVSCGWNSAGFGQGRGYEMVEILIVAHGGAHNDTIVTVERKGLSQACLTLAHAERAVTPAASERILLSESGGSPMSETVGQKKNIMRATLQPQPGSCASGQRGDDRASSIQRQEKA